MRRGWFVFTSLSVLACARESSAPPAGSAAAPLATVTSAVPPAVEQPPAPRKDGRLPSVATPIHQTIALDVDPSQPRFHGTTSIDVDVAHPTRYLVLHGHDLNVTEVTATAGDKIIGATATARAGSGAVEPQELVLAFNEALPAGPVKLSLSFDAPFANNLSGLYRVKEGERWYAFTQFEATDARRAFPCFDEPAFKATYDLSIRAPKGMLAVANSPESRRADEGAVTRFEFATTPRLSTYLVAFAVGDFDVREGSQSPVPVRIVTVKGKAGLGEFALDATAGLVKKLGDYFAIPYPFAKLDVVAVPDFAAGAMENPGLITFRESELLLDPKHASVHDRREATLTIAHELAHMWFGDLVTMQWWNDVWLNEGFATWMETKITDAFRPQYGAKLDAIVDAQSVMNLDALASARAVRQPVVSNSDIDESFDGISYQKGSAVLGMLEHALGEETFQRGVRDYLNAHAWKNANVDDLLGALDHASGRNVTALAATFLDRPGVPVVAVKPSCDGGKTTYDLRQSSWRLLGTPAGSDSSPWRIPFCVHQDGGKDECTELQTEHGVLESSGACGTLAFPNAADAGYYRFALGEKDARVLVGNLAHLDAVSRLGLVTNLWAQVRSGAMPADVLLDLLPSFDRETDPHVVGEVIDTLSGFELPLVDPSARAAFRSYVAARMAPHKKRLGWRPLPGESDTDAMLRPRVLDLLGAVARDAATLREAEATTRKWLADPQSVDADVAEVAVGLSSMQGDAARWEQLRKVAQTARTPEDRTLALSALGKFEDPKVRERTFDILLTDDVRMQDFWTVLGGRHASSMFRHSDASSAFFRWMTAHWEAARAKLPGELAGGYSYVLLGVCSPEQRDEELAFLRPHLADVEGASRPLAENAEAVTTCAALRTQDAPAVTKFLTGKTPSKG